MKDLLKNLIDKVARKAFGHTCNGFGGRVTDDSILDFVREKRDIIEQERLTLSCSASKRLLRVSSSSSGTSMSSSSSCVLECSAVASSTFPCAN